MNNRKGVIGLTLAVIMVASIFAVINPVPIVASPGPVVDGVRSPGEWDEAWKLADDPDDPWNNGYDLLRVYHHYEAGEDKMYYMYEVDGIAGDSDGDGNPNTPDDGFNDQWGVGSKEGYLIALNADNDTTTGITLHGYPGYDLTVELRNNTPQVTWHTAGMEPSGFVAEAAIKTAEPYTHVVEFSISNVSEFMDPTEYVFFGYIGSQMDAYEEDYLEQPVTPPSIPPVLEFDFEHICCLNMRFNGSASHDPDGDIVNHTWDFGDGNITGPISGTPGVIEHRYTACGDKTVKLSGYDNDGLDNETTKTVHVPCPPRAKANANKTNVIAGAGEVVKFSCQPGTWVEPGLTLTYNWTFDDGGVGTSDDQCDTTRVIDGEPGDVICATLTVNDSHCEDSDTVCVRIREKGNCTLRVYGRLNEGAGDFDVTDPVSGLHPENPPYTDPEAPFYPQAGQSPRKDFITFDPIIMYHNDNDWDNDGVTDTVYADCIKDGSNPTAYDASEKIFKRMWYEPTEWFKDENGNGILDLVLIKGDDKIGWVPAGSELMHDLIKNGYKILPHNDDDKLGDIYAPAIKQEFTYMMLDASVVPQPKAVPTGGISSMLIPAATHVPDNGIDSFDMNGDGVVDVDDAVLIESESSLGMDIDNDGVIETLSPDGAELTGDETLVLTTKALVLGIDDELQFFDHKIVLTDVFGTPENPYAIIDVYYQGHTSPPGSYKTRSNIGKGERRFYSFGIDNTGKNPQGPFFIWVINADKDKNTVTVRIGRMFGNTWANIGANPYWNQKQFYVDGVCYNVVAIKTEGNDNFKYVTIRQKLSKLAVKIPNHTQHLKAWGAGEILPEMPQYNMNHTIVQDVQTEWTIPEAISDKYGPILEAPALEIYYLAETLEPRFLGELKEIYHEYEAEEGWMIEWFHTMPWAYTLFKLPPEEEAGAYLLTSAFYAPESLNVLWDGGEPYGEEPIDAWFGKRLKFWYKDCTGPYFVDRDGSLRIYGYLNKGAGNYGVTDPRTDLPPENPPYTDSMAPFYPQADEAPEKDFITFNPIIMYHNDNDWDNDGIPDTVYADSIKNNYYDASEKIFKRMWYEPIEFFKDEYNWTGVGTPGVLDVLLTDGSCVPITAFEDPTFVWQLKVAGISIVPANSNDTLCDIYAPAIKQEFTYMMLDASVVPQPVAAPTGGGSSMLIPMASWEPGNGIDSFDADGDGVPDRVLIESESSLGMDIDNDGAIEPLSSDGAELTGDETLVLTLDDKILAKNHSDYPDEIRFFDHRIVLKEVMGTPEHPEAVFDVYYMGAGTGPGSKTDTVSIGAGETNYFSFGADNTGKSPQGPFFIHVSVADGAEDKAIVKVGRMFGETWANIGMNPWWNEKQFYVDGVCYNVVAIKTDGYDNFKYVTFRQKLPKLPVKIPQHTQDLLPWGPDEVLPEMPQYNMNHTIAQDVQPDWTIPEIKADKIGPTMEAPALNITYVSEDIEDRFQGELKEIYYEPEATNETWMIEWFHTIPYQYTGFMLPPNHGLYMVTSAFHAPEACYHLWDGGDEDENPIDCGVSARLKWWFDPTDPTDIYVNPPPVPKEWTIEEWYDAPAHGGNGDGDVCGDEMELVNAVLDYIFAFGTGTYPFGEGGIFDEDDLAELIIKYTVICTQ